MYNDVPFFLRNLQEVPKGKSKFAHKMYIHVHIITMIFLSPECHLCGTFILCDWNLAGSSFEQTVQHAHTFFHKETNVRLKSAHTVNFCCLRTIFPCMHLGQNALKQINLFPHVFQSKEWCGRKSSLSLWDWRGGKRYGEYSDRFFLICFFHYCATPSRHFTLTVPLSTQEYKWEPGIVEAIWHSAGEWCSLMVMDYYGGWHL